MNIQFIVDGKSIDLNDLEVDFWIEIIEKLLDQIEGLISDGYSVYFGEDLFETPLLGEKTFWELFGPTSSILLKNEILERSSAIFGRMQRCSEVGVPQEKDLKVYINNDQVEVADSIAWAHRQVVASGMPFVACICAKGRRQTGISSVIVSGEKQSIWFAESAQDIEKYFRWLIAEYANTEGEIERLARSAFRRLEFIHNCFSGIKGMSKPCRQLAPIISKHLSVFSDEGERIFAGSWCKAPTEFGFFGINISDENGKTKRNQTARKERLRIIGGEELFFWWHSKIEPHQDRIHIYPNKVLNGGKIVVGIFCRHLTT